MPMRRPVNEPGPAAIGDGIDIIERQIGVFEHRIHHRQKRPAVRQPRALIGGGERRASSTTAQETLFADVSRARIFMRICLL